MFVRHGPLWFRIVTVVLLVWGMMGCFACLQQVRLGADAMGPATAYDRALYAALPGWYNLVYAVAVGSGFVGAVLLFMRKASAKPFFVVSLVAVVVQFGWLFATSDIVAHKGVGATLTFPAIIVAIALFQIWIAGHARGKGWIG